MSIIIRLQNLPWAADSVDIRRYFSGLSIPEGGVHIVGGEMGDAFIAFSTDEDARLAMEKDGGKIHEMQIKLLLSSRTEMTRVIERARQQNFAGQAQATPPLVQPPPAPVPVQPSAPLDRDRKSGGSRRSPSPHHRSRRDRSPSSRDRYRSPDSSRRSSKRERSRSPPRSSRSINRDTDRRSDRYKRDDRRHDEDSRYRDSDRKSLRDQDCDMKKYPEPGFQGDNRLLDQPSGFHGNDRQMDQPPNFQGTNRQMDQPPGFQGNNRQMSKPPNFQGNNQQMNQPPGFKSNSRQMDHPPQRDSPNRGYYDNSSNYPSQTISKDLPPAFMNPALADKNPKPVVDNTPLDKLKVSLKQISPTTTHAFHQSQMPFSNIIYDHNPHAPAESFPVTNPGNQSRERIRVSRFEPEGLQIKKEPYFSDSNDNKNILPRQSPMLNDEPLPRSRDFQQKPANSWPNQDNKRNSRFHDPQPHNAPQIDQSPIDRNYSRPVPMDLDPPDNNSYIETSSAVPQRPPLQPFIKDDNFNRNAKGPHNRIVPTNIPNEWQNSASSSVEIRGLPPDSTIGEIIDMFSFSIITPQNICIVANNQGIEKALVRFPNRGDFERALNGPPCFIRNRRCLIVDCPDEVFESTVSVQNSFKSRPKPKPREEDLVVQLRGLPYSCTQEDLVRFFDGIRFRELTLCLSPNGRTSGIAFVELASPQDFRSALTQNGKMIGNRYITISVSCKEMMVSAKGEEIIKPMDAPPKPPILNENDRYPMPPQNPIPVPKPIDELRSPPRLMNNSPGPIRQPPCCLALRNLPPNINNDVLVNFFKDLNVRITAIHCLMNLEDLPSGDAFIEVASQKDADISLSGDGKIIFGNRVSIKQIPYQEVVKFLDGTNNYPDQPPVNPAPLLQTPDLPVVENPRKILLSEAPIEGHIVEHPPNDYPAKEPPKGFYHPEEVPHPRFHAEDVPHRGFPPDERPRRGAPMMDFPRGDFYRGERPRMERAPRMPFNRGERPRMTERGPRMMSRDGRPPFSRMRGPSHRHPLRHADPKRGPDGFGAMGCVVGINNLHFRAGLEELQEFFCDFKLSADSILRRFNDNDQATGEARVAFRNPYDAERAVRELNNKMVMGRPLSLTLL